MAKCEKDTCYGAYMGLLATALIESGSLLWFGLQDYHALRAEFQMRLYF